MSQDSISFTDVNQNCPVDPEKEYGDLLLSYPEVFGRKLDAVNSLILGEPGPGKGFYSAPASAQPDFGKAKGEPHEMQSV